MNKIIKIGMLSIGALVLGGALSSCEQTDAEHDKGKTPVIKYARSCDIDKSDSLLVSASLGARVCFVGDNMGDVQQVWFNDQKAKLNPNMVTSHTIIVDIPNNLPGEVTNIARFITSKGTTVDYEFNVFVPAPRIDDVSCEYARAGEEMVINGAYFANDPNVPLKVVFPGDIEAKIKSIAQEQLVVEVPEGTHEGPIVISSIYGEGESGFNYMDTNGMLFDFDGQTGLTNHGWHNQPIQNEDGISGNYVQLGDGSTTLAAGGWDDGKFSFEYWAGSWNTPTDYPEREGARLFDVADFSDYKNKVLKFELFVPENGAWQANPMQIIFSGTDKVSMGNAGTDVFGNKVAGANNDYLKQVAGWGRGLWKPWTEATPYTTKGKWVTVVYPLSELTYGADAKAAKSVPSEVSDFANLQIFLWVDTTDGANAVWTGVDCTPILRIDNIRVVKK